ncbi:aspartate 1-decarboxylase [Mesorhizobium sp.]|uniref:aspartate 1-decarboxylase n=1 Tax=Mesorhizobium sp. TaxID=1871066 RepID=UPI00257EDA16|nr:aspartate 1-decarboxylase [Mesorhizobium sp.]
MLDAVKAWPGNLAAGRGAIAPASRDCVSTRSHGKSCRPGRRNSSPEAEQRNAQESKKPKSRLSMSSVWNKNSGARISTYVILGERGSRCCILNGAAARTCQPDDPTIVCNSIYLDEAHITSLKPRIVTFDQDNNILDRLRYSVDLDADGRYTFSILDEANEALAIPALVSGA